MIQFQLLFQVADDKAAAFENTFFEVFQPALSRQPGFISAKLLRLFSATAQKEIEASPSEFNYQVNFFFESEEARRRWSKCADHDVAWPKFSALAQQALWRGFDVIERG
ncbi:MAG TPA: antibiotic biosynthesis monooxygenase [Polyangiaceae bacterium]|jgi:heme-degrading monooxygenase HmoA|nr:antibiotic biosynthesis monooxygenase [Polyangiaceae bacterium]